MARLFRSKSCTLGPRNSMPPLTSSPHTPSQDQDQDEEEDEDDAFFRPFINTDDDDDCDDDHYDFDNPATTPFITLRRSLVTCSVEADDVASDVDIGWPTDVRHVSHVTFDRFNGFLGLPLELQPDVPRKPPSASASVFGVSAQSMQCSYDHRGNSVPTILLRMQNRLYSEGGLQAEGIFRINAENSQEENVRNQLNRGIVPHGIDVHCLSGTGDALQYRRRVHPAGKVTSSTEGALLDWAINLMADVVHHEHENKMNARNIAMVFAPNMTKMADPLTALIHAVQVMNFLKTLIMKTLRDREESAATTLFTDSFGNTEGSLPVNTTEVVLLEQAFDDRACKEAATENLLRSSTLERLECDNSENSLSIRSKSDVGEKYECTLGRSSPAMRKRRTLGHSFKDEYDNMEAEGILHRLSLRKGMQKLRRHPVFQLSKTVKKSGGGGLAL
ncbi:UNVERIFIED_CONTAM: Rho GTPase-activating protein 3 [Sesamum angustifolium]|uniref:Rho GTPase-activating protein 3 n=1 Tax=Sesamum angustifolium TaxID=2727405 RepID=A0AAW2J7I3_9LAMI